MKKNGYNYRNEKDNYYEDYSYDNKNYNIHYKYKNYFNNNYGYNNNYNSTKFYYFDRLNTYKTKRYNYSNNNYNNNYNYYNNDYYYYNNNFHNKYKNNSKKYEQNYSNKKNKNNNEINNISDNNLNKNNMNNDDSNKIIDIKKEIEEKNNKKGNIIINDDKKQYNKIITEFVDLYKIVKTPIESLFIIDNFDGLIVNLKKKIFELFEIKEIKEELLYKRLLEIIQENDNSKYSNSKLFDVFIFYIQKNIISINDNEDIKKLAFDFFINYSSKINIDFYEKYITLFHIEEKLSKYFETKENILNFKNSLLILKILNIHNRISFNEFNLFTKKDEINFLLIKQLFQTYNGSENEFLNLYKYINSKIPKNSIPIIHLKSLLNSITLKDDYKKLLIDYLLELPKETDVKSYRSYYDIIYKNKLEKFYPELNRDKLLIHLVYTLKYYDTALRIIKTFDEEKIKTLDKKLLKDLLYSIDLLDINNIIFLLEYLPEEFNTIIKKYKDNKNQKSLKKIIKKINIKEKTECEIFKKMEDNNIRGFFIWKSKQYYDEHLDILLEHINNQREFEICFKTIFRIIKKNYSIDKLSYILNYATNKNYKLSFVKKKTQLNLIKLAQKENNSIKFPEDKFGPKTEGCIYYSKDEINVIFIDNCKDFIKNYELYFEKSKYIGIDTEWRESLYSDIKTKTAIMQLSDYDGKNILILDMIELIKYNEFKELFIKVFNEHIFISFGFSNDLEIIPDILKFFFEKKAKIIDITYLYQLKYYESCPSLSKVCKKIIEKELCKIEQCSNWESRPLRQSQLHYAAVDSLICCLIFKKLNS